jgi:hypothetical protein
MAKYSLTVSGETLDELYASVAAFLDRPVLVTGTAPSTLVQAFGDIRTAAVVPVEPVSTDEDGPAAAGAPEFDKAGTPWDKRIHSSSKAINEDGTWRRRRNLADITYTTVMAELAQRPGPGAVPSAAPVVTVPPVAAAPTVPQVTVPPVGVVDNGPIAVPPAAVVPTPVMAAPTADVPSLPVPTIAAVPAVPEAPAAPVAAAPVAAPEPPPQAGMAFGALMIKIAEGMKAGKFTSDQLNAWVTAPAPGGWGMANINQFGADPGKTEQFYNWLKSANLVD